MKIIIKIITIILLPLSFAISCKKEPVQGVNIESKLEVWVGETVTLTPTFVPPNAYNKNVSWESANPDIAIVENGKVTGITIGRVIIKVITEDGGRTATCSVTVIQPIEPKEMIWVEGGTFMMGCNDDECRDNELPRHEVTLDGFHISKYVVTQKEWVAAMGENSSSLIWQGDKMPAYKASWEKVQLYINRLNAFTGKNYRLPTEAEWEFAARGGNKSKGYKYSGSNNIAEVAWYHYNSDDRIHPVGLKKPNELGIYDMSGNMIEWCNDYYDNYPSVPQINPTGPETGIDGILRGGHCTDFSHYCRVSSRRQIPQNYYHDKGIYGFRLVHP